MAQTYTELQARGTYLASFEAWSDVSTGVTMATLINRAWFKFSFDAELVIGSQNVTTVIGTNQYTLTGAVKRILDCIYDTASTKVGLRHSTEDYERNADTAWLYKANGTPDRYAFAPFNLLSLIPAPDAVKTVRVRGFVEGTALSAGSDVLPIPDYLEEAVCIYAAYLQGVAYSQGEGSARLDRMLQDYQGYVNDGLNYARLRAQGS